MYAIEMGQMESGRAVIAMLRTIVDRLQLARHGSAELDAMLDAVLARGTGVSDTVRNVIGGLRPAIPGAPWSRELTHVLALLPHDYNYSLGHRDGVCWAWIQPNDRWEPHEYEARHDHPGGSGLTVARTAALALACAAVILLVRRLETVLDAAAVSV